LRQAAKDPYAGINVLLISRLPYYFDALLPNRYLVP
jgi:hypothetical protein